MMSHKLSGAVSWFTRLAKDNSRDFWARERDAYRLDVREPFLALLAIVDPGRHETWSIYRPHRDTRFSADQSPLKTFIGAVRVDADGTGRYLQLSADGILAASGGPYFAPDQLRRWREAVADERGITLAEAVTYAESRGLTVGPGRAPTLRTAPRGIDPTHPRVGLLRWKGIDASVRVAADDDAASAVTKAWRDAEPLRHWCAEYVGPSALERPRR